MTNMTSKLGNLKKVALITGITGQDGSFLAEFLTGGIRAGLSKGL